MVPRYFLSTLLIILLPILCGCVGTPPTIDEFSKAVYCEKPDKSTYESKVKARFEDYLKDPDSSKFKFDKPIKGWYGKTLSNLAGPR